MRANWLLLGWMGVVAAADPAATQRWKYMGYDGFVESIDALAGPSAIDCGFLDRRNETFASPRVRQAADCVGAALNGREPFKFGTIPPNSNVIYVLLRSAAHELWEVRYERTLSKRDLVETQLSQKCKNMTFDAGAVTFMGIDCVFVSSSGLPTYDPNSRH